MARKNKNNKSKSKSKLQLEQELNFKSLENEHLKIDLATKEPQESEMEIEGREELLKENFSFLKDFVDSISELDINDDKKIFQKTLRCYEQAQQRNFIIHNLLEAVKRGESLGNVMKKYSKLGIIDESQAQGIANIEGNRRKAIIPNSGGFLVNTILKGLKKVGSILIKIMLTALKKMGSPLQVIIGLNGSFMPTVQFAFDPKKGIGALTGKDILDVIQENW